MSGAVSAESGGGGGSRRGRGSGNQDFDLNLASIIDCLTVLITFMLASASFLSIGILDAGIAAAGTEASTQTPPPVNIALELKQSHTIELKLTGKETRTVTIPATSQGGEKPPAWDYEQLGRQLASIKTKWTGVSAVTLTAENTVEYRDIVKTMEATRKTMPVVLLGGF